ncbi:hypothetical protein [Nocardioides sp. Root190]|uniref:hypothetical protein n=1 Tax=Nocardioides sp. Root190 TaxID=1736488 RepID=UPI000A7DD641|nr:hypothetical protein [Nocardioides sp. Root190]
MTTAEVQDVRYWLTPEGCTAAGGHVLVVSSWACLSCGTSLGPMCPECRNGKHANCDQIAMDENDELTECTCTDPTHSPDPSTERTTP